jgi:UDP-N-acetylglucosamine 2-epimerase
MKIISIVGARPQFIKSAPVSTAIRNVGHQELLIHTGQHYDYGMSKVFFEEMGIKEPYLNLNVGSGSHASQTGQMLMGIEKVLFSHQPDIVLVYGDTNSTLAGALAAVKLQIKIAHIEAGLRSYNRKMPEEHNRVLTDHCSDLLFCPTQTAVNNLQAEGVKKGVHLVGDTMYDAILKFSVIARQNSIILNTLRLSPKDYFLITIHRPYNTDNLDALQSILIALQRIKDKVVFPIHPRTLEVINKASFTVPNNVQIIDPVGYLDILMLEMNAKAILTDSGGIQKEAYFLNVPCLTLRPETEWIETTQSGWNILVGTDPDKIIDALAAQPPTGLADQQLFGDGHASEKIVSFLDS